jgi:hypothetical protein
VALENEGWDVQLIVLGMHRSGTSVLARTLNLMGAYFGTEGSGTGANAENPKGFWERRDVRMVNDAVLHAVGADWNRVARFDMDTLPVNVVEEFIGRASSLVLELDAHRPWFIKEPRLCLLLPLWRRVLESPIAIHIHRHPVEVAASLFTRNAIPLPAGLALWETYVRAAAQAADGLPAVRVSHRRLMTRPMQEIERLYQQLTASGVQGLRMPSEREIGAFVDQGLYRERESRDDLREYLRSPQVALFQELESGALPTAPVSDAARQSLRDYEAALPPLRLRTEHYRPPGGVDTALHERVGAREQEAKLLRETVAKVEAMLRQRDEQLSAAKTALGRLEAEAAVAKREIAAQRGELDAMSKRATQAETAAAERQARLSSLQRDLEDGLRRAEEAERRLERTERSLEERFRELAELTRLLLARDAEVAQASHDLAASEGKLRATVAELNAIRADLGRIHASWAWRLAVRLRAIARAGREKKTSPGIATERALVEGSGLFDEVWYLKAYPDVARSGIDPLEHYLMFGGPEQRSPGPGFDVAEYLRLNPDVDAAGMNPLVHYIRHGRDEGRRLA